MSSIDGYSQEYLDEMWEALKKEEGYDGTDITVDDEIEQIFKVHEQDGGLFVRRKPGGQWEKLTNEHPET